MPQPDSRVTAELTSTLRPRGTGSRTVENAPGPAEDRRFGRRLGAVLATLLLLVVGGVVGEHVLGHRNAVPVVGSWVLHEIEHDGRATVAPVDLGSDQSGVSLRFGTDGTFGINGGCSTSGGDYDVSWDDLSFRNVGAAASACGYATTDAQRLALAIGAGVNAALDDGATVSRPSDDRLELSVDDGDYVLRYDRAPG